MTKRFHILVIAALMTAGMAACSSNQSGNNQNDSINKPNGTPEGDSAVNSARKPVDTATKDSSKMLDTMRR